MGCNYWKLYVDNASTGLSGDKGLILHRLMKGKVPDMRTLVCPSILIL